MVLDYCRTSFCLSHVFGYVSCGYTYIPHSFIQIHSKQNKTKEEDSLDTDSR